jgi:hypothetical protein
MVADELYEKALPVLQDDALDEEDKTDQLEELMRKAVARAMADSSQGSDSRQQLTAYDPSSARLRHRPASIHTRKVLDRIPVHVTETLAPPRLLESAYPP